MRMLSLDDLRGRSVVTEIATMYGGPMKVRKLSVRAANELQKLAKAAEGGDLLAFGRALLSAAVVDPVLDDAALVLLEEDAQAFNDLIAQILRHNGMTEEVQRQAARDFRDGDRGSGGSPAGEQ